MFILCLLVISSISGALYNGGVAAETLKVKIVEIPQHSRYFPSINTDPPKPLVLRAPPAEVSGPPHLRLLNGLCFKTREKIYIYEFCPFQNVTQIEDKVAWNRYQGILGVWRQWIVEGDRFVGMHFAMGDQCGRTERKVDVIFQCSTTSELTNITEPKTCNYRIMFYTPLACFKGAMQVYRVLTEQEIQLWDSFTEEHANDELTSLGLKRRQEQLLLNAGLLYNFTKDELLKETPPTQASRYYPASKREESASCQQRVALLEQQLSDLKEELGVTKWVMSRVPVMVATVQRMLGNRTRSITVNVTEPPSQLQQVPGTDPPSPVISDQPTTRVGVATDDIDNPVRPDDYIVPDNPDTRPGLNARPAPDAHPVPDARPLDTRPAAPDTHPAAPDTRPAAPDTRPAAPDTRPAAPDTRPAAPDTRPAAPDTRPAAPDSRPAPDTHPGLNARPAAPDSRPAPDTHPGLNARPADDAHAIPNAHPIPDAHAALDAHAAPDVVNADYYPQEPNRRIAPNDGGKQNRDLPQEQPATHMVNDKRTEDRNRDTL